MKITTDDWHFRSSENNTVVVDLFLSNGQHALLEVNPMRDATVTNGQIPEMIVFCEYLGEKLSEGNCSCRWVSRPPDKTCPWSNVEIPPALLQQIKEKMGYTS